MGIITSQNKQKNLMDALYIKGEDKVLHLLKTGPKTEEELAKQLEKLQASLFYSRTKIRVTDTNLFTKTLLKALCEKRKIQKDSSVYKLKDKKL